LSVGVEQGLIVLDFIGEVSGRHVAGERLGHGDACSHLIAKRPQDRRQRDEGDRLGAPVEAQAHAIPVGFARIRHRPPIAEVALCVERSMIGGELSDQLPQQVGQLHRQTDCSAGKVANWRCIFFPDRHF